MTTPAPERAIPDGHHHHDDALLSRRREWVGLVVGAAVVMAVRAWVVSVSRFPRLVADETAYLAMARELAGGPRWNLGVATTYAPGYSLLLTPWFTLDLSADTIFRGAMATNVALAGATFLVVARLARRLTTLSSPVAHGAAAVSVSLPALAVTGTLAWSDALTPLCFALLALAVVRLLDAPTAGRAAAAAAAAVGGYVAHNRFLPLVGLVALVVVVLAARRRLGAVAAGAVVGGMAVFMGVERLARSALYDRLYEPGGQVGAADGKLSKLTQVPELAIAGTGQAWYLLATTGGLAGFGAFALLRAWWRSLGGTAGVGDWIRRRGRPWAVGESPVPPGEPVAGLRRLDAGTLITLAALMALPFGTSTLVMTGASRADHAIYGRYNEMFVSLLVLCGLASLIATTAWRDRLRDAAVVVGVTGASGLLVWTTRLETLQGVQVAYSTLGLMALTPRGAHRLRTATVIGIALLLVLAGAALVRRGRGVVLLVVASALVLVGTVRSGDQIDSGDSPGPRHAVELGAILRPGEVVTYRLTDDLAMLRPFYRYQFYAPDVVAQRGFGPVWERGDPFVMSRIDDAELAAAGYRSAWADPTGEAGLWVAPGPRQDEMAAAGILRPPLPEGVG